jgi:hypothetical protein
VKRVHHRDPVGDFFSCGGLEAGKAIRGKDLESVAQRWFLGLESGLEHLLGLAFALVQQLCGPVPSQTGLRSMTVTNSSPRRVWHHACSSTPWTWIPSKRVGWAISNWRAVARRASLTVARKPEPVGDPGDRHPVDDDNFQRPHHGLRRQFRPRRGGQSRVLISDLPAARSPSPHRGSGSGGCGHAESLPPSRADERQWAQHAFARHPQTGVAPVIRVDHSTEQHVVVGVQLLANRFQAESSSRQNVARSAGQNVASRRGPGCNRDLRGSVVVRWRLAH